MYYLVDYACFGPEGREKQLETVLGGVVNIWGAIEGYAGQKELPGMDPLMLEDSQPSQKLYHHEAREEPRSISNYFKKTKSSPSCAFGSSWFKKI